MLAQAQHTPGTCHQLGSGLGATLGQQLRRLASDRTGELARGDRPQRAIQDRWTRPPQGAPISLRIYPLAIMHQIANLRANPNGLHTNTFVISALRACQLATPLVPAPSCCLDHYAVFV